MENCKLSSTLIMQTSYITNSSHNDASLPVNTVDLSISPYYISSAGIYIVTNAGSGYPLFLNYSYNPSTANGQTVIIVNQDPLNNIVYTDIPEYPTLDSEVVYKFVSDGVEWRKVSTPGAMYANGNFPGIDEIVLPSAGIYILYVGKSSVTLPNPSLYDGQTIILFNPQNTNTCKVNGGLYDIDNSFYDPFITDSNSVLKLKSVGGNWRIVKYSVA